MKILSILVSVIAITLSACGSKYQVPVYSGKASTGIINGQNVKESDTLSKSVVALYTSDGYLCTGSLYSEDIIITAAHCISKKATIKAIFNLNIDAVLDVEHNEEALPYYRNVKRAIVSPKYDKTSDAMDNTGDIAVLYFEGGLPAGYKPAKLATVEMLDRGVTATVAGYGVSKVFLNDIKNPKKYPQLKEKIQSGQVICDKNMNNCSEIEMDGDGILKYAEAPIQTVGETEVVLNERKAGTCEGDSGGPAYVKVNGEYLLFGATSRGSATCDSLGIYTIIPEYKDWITKAIAVLKSK